MPLRRTVSRPKESAPATAQPKAQGVTCSPAYAGLMLVLCPLYLTGAAALRLAGGRRYRAEPIDRSKKKSNRDLLRLDPSFGRTPMGFAVRDQEYLSPWAAALLGSVIILCLAILSALFNSIYFF